MTTSKFAFLLPLSLAVFSCGTESATESPADSQTHWLSPCDADTDCGDFQCLCGVCAQSCMRASDCDGTAADTCVAEDDAAVQALCREPAEVRLCLTGCDDDDDCSDGQRCENTACVPEDAQSGTPEPEPSPTEPNEPNGGAGGDGNEPAGGSGGDGGAVGGGPSTGNGGAGGEPVANGGASTGEGGAPGQGGAGGDPYSLPLSDGAVVPGDAYTGCGAEDECIIVEPLCSQCCGQVAINASTFEQYQENYVLACDGYEGGVCDCQAPEAEAQCVDGQCVVSFPGAEPAQICENTGGTWDESSCGHYSCGRPPVCTAEIPGCDCGLEQNFDQQLGCVEDPACTSSSEDEQALCVDSGGTWDEGSCGHYDCGQTPACEALIPGCDCGLEQNFEPGLGCVESIACADPDARAACEDTGGVWDANSCGDYECGLPPNCDAIIPGCNCGEGRNFSEGDGCMAAPSCDAG